MKSEHLISELSFKAVRSSGPGGQNVNKVSSKVVLTFNLLASQALSLNEKAILQTKLSSRLTNESVLVLNCDEGRSQVKNKEIIIKRFLSIIKNGLIIPKMRLETKIPKSVIKKRIKDKKSLSVTKFFRKKTSYTDNE